MSSYSDPLNQLKIINDPNNIKQWYTEEEDRFLICNLHKLGANNKNVYTELRDVVR